MEKYKPMQDVITTVGELKEFLQQFSDDVIVGVMVQREQDVPTFSVFNLETSCFHVTGINDVYYRDGLKVLVLDSAI